MSHFDEGSLASETTRCLRQRPVARDEPDQARDIASDVLNGTQSLGSYLVISQLTAEDQSPRGTWEGL